MRAPLTLTVLALAALVSGCQTGGDPHKTDASKRDCPPVIEPPPENGPRLEIESVQTSGGTVSFTLDPQGTYDNGHAATVEILFPSTSKSVVIGHGERARVVLDGFSGPASRVEFRVEGKDDSLVFVPWQSGASRRAHVWSEPRVGQYKDHALFVEFQERRVMMLLRPSF